MICRCPPWCSHMLSYFKVCWVFFTPCLLLVSTDHLPGAGGQGEKSSFPSISPSPLKGAALAMGLELGCPGPSALPGLSVAAGGSLGQPWGSLQHPARPRPLGPGGAAASHHSCLLCPSVHAHLHLPGHVQRAPALRHLRVPRLGHEPGHLHGRPHLPADPGLGRCGPVPRVGDAERRECARRGGAQGWGSDRAGAAPVLGMGRERPATEQRRCCPFSKREKGLEPRGRGERWGLSPSAAMPAAAPSGSDAALCPVGAWGSPCSPSPTPSASRKPPSPCAPGGWPPPRTWPETSLTCHSPSP